MSVATRVMTITQKIEYDHRLSYRGKCPVGMKDVLSGRIQDLMGVLILEPDDLAIPVYISEEWSRGSDVKLTHVYIRVFKTITMEDKK